MDTLLIDLLKTIPNMGVALVMLFWQKQTIESLLLNQAKLIDRMMSYFDKDKESLLEQQRITSITLEPKQ